MRALEVLQQLLVRRSLFEWIQLYSVQVLQQGVTQQVDVVGIPNDSRNRLQAGFLGSTQTTLTHDELITRLLSLQGRHLPHHDGLQQSHFRDRSSQLRDVLFVEDLARLARIGMDQVHRNLSKTSSRNRN